MADYAKARSRAPYFYAQGLLLVLFLYLPPGGYERMMEGKYRCFVLLSAAFLLSQLPRLRELLRMGDALRLWAAAYLGWTALSALCSPYGAAALTGGTRREGLLTVALYVLCFLACASRLRAGRRLLYAAGGAAALCALLTLAQLTGRNPLGLYPAGLSYYDGDAAYAGFFAGTAGNADFTAFLLALAVCVLAAAAARLREPALLLPVVPALWALYRLGVAAAWVGLACAGVWGLGLLFPARRRAALLCSAALSAAALLFLFFYTGENRTLSEAAALLHGRWDGSFGSGRLAIWRDCLELVRRRPLLGGGPDTLWLRGLEPFSWFTEDGVTPVDVTAAHNEYLNILVNQGAPALAAYLALLGTALLRCFRRAGEPRFAVCGAGLLCYAAMACFSVSTCITAPYVWLLLSLTGRDAGEGPDGNVNFI